MFLLRPRFLVVITFQSSDPAVLPTPGFENTPPLTYAHKSAAAAAKRLASLISGRAAWVPVSVRGAKHFGIVDQKRPGQPPLALIPFRQTYGLTNARIS